MPPPPLVLLRYFVQKGLFSMVVEPFIADSAAAEVEPREQDQNPSEQEQETTIYLNFEIFEGHEVPHLLLGF